ncbi:sortase [Candidatus Daviesbacteria bacterium]|nr:sortase [Candidatus Daviesbacteria bacterium]
MRKTIKQKILSWWAYFLGGALIAGALFYLTFSFKDVLIMEAKYRLGINLSKAQTEKVPENNSQKDFTISVPKAGIDAKVFPEIDPYNTVEYKDALSKGAAHAKGSALPGNKGNVFIFAHSTSSQSFVAQYNAIFYLLNKLDKGDEVYLSFGGSKFKYKVTETKIIAPEQVEYLDNQSSDKKTVTLMTCWPAGTSLKRLLVIGELS